jgi:hypothetical protein
MYTGSNYGIISTLNSGNGTLVNINDSVVFGYELIQHYTSCSVLLKISGTDPILVMNVYISNDNIGTSEKKTTYRYTSEQTVIQNIELSGKYIKLELQTKTANVSYNLQTRYNNSTTPELDQGYTSFLNSFYPTVNVNPGNIYSGVYEPVTQYSMITIMIHGNAITPGTICDGSFNAYFSSDGIHDDRIVNYVIQDVAADGTTSNTTSLTFNPAHTLIPIAPYFKIVYTNGSNGMTNFRISTMYHKQKSKSITSRATQLLSDYVDADTTRSILNGRTFGTTLSGGRYENVNVLNGLLTASIKDPTTAFGELLSANPTPQIQYDFGPGQPYDVVEFYRNTTATTSYEFNNGMVIPTVSGTNSIIQILSRDYVKYKSGQGADARFTVFFPNGYVAGCNQSAGLMTREDALMLGYFDQTVSGTNEFSILYRSYGLQPIWQMTISGTVTSSGNLSFTFGGTAITVGVTVGDNAKQVASKIADTINSGTYSNLNTYGWKASYWYNGVTYIVECVFLKALDKVITTTTPQLGITIGLSQKRVGSAPTDVYIPQSTWNIDRCKDQGSLQANYLYNPSGFILDTTKGNVFKITYQYLGFGAITFFVENPTTGFFMPVHQIKYANTSVKPSVRIANYKIGISLENTTNSGSVSMNHCSVAVFLQGVFKPSPIYRSYGVIMVRNTHTGFPLTVENANIMMGIRGVQSYTSTNSDGSMRYTINRNNVPFNFFTCSITSNTNSNNSLIFIVVKNPTTLTYTSSPVSGSAIPWKTIGNSMVQVFDGLPFTNTGPTSVTYTGGDVILEIPVPENNVVSFNLNQLDINLSPLDTFLIGIYGNASSNFDATTSLSWYVNM